MTLNDLRGRTKIFDLGFKEFNNHIINPASYVVVMLHATVKPEDECPIRDFYLGFQASFVFNSRFIIFAWNENP